MKNGFKNAGSFENPTMFLDTREEDISICGRAGTDYMNIFFSVRDGVIEDVKYMCSCDPPANVIIEVLCDLVRGRTLEQAKAIEKEEFFEVIGSDGGVVRRKVWGAIELLNRVIYRYETGLFENK